ncbi:MAG: hypothetical protein KF691_15595 [Phycisphaeraceae bacterium]|nr:hypothetical protein [Phycisphaeraceae bacterium]
MTRDLRRMHRAAWILITPALALLLVLAIVAHRRAVRVLDSQTPTPETRR